MRSRLFRAAVLAAVIALVLSACGRGNADPSAASASTDLNTDGGVWTRETLRLELMRDAADAETLMQAMRTLPDVLSAALRERGVEIGTVSVTVGASPAASMQALSAGSVDLAVVPGARFLELGGGAVPLLTQSVPQADGGTDGGERWLLLAGGSEYGRRLADRAASNTPLTWDELDRAAWAVDEAGEMVSVWLADHYEGNTLSDLTSLTCLSVREDGGTLLTALAEGTADIAAVPAQEAEAALAGGAAVLGETEPYYAVLLAAGAEDETLREERFVTALADALESVCTQDAALCGALGGALTAPVNDEALNGMRRLATLGG